MKRSLEEAVNVKNVTDAIVQVTKRIKTENNNPTEVTGPALELTKESATTTEVNTSGAGRQAGGVLGVVIADTISNTFGLGTAGRTAVQIVVKPMAEELGNFTEKAAITAATVAGTFVWSAGGAIVSTLGAPVLVGVGLGGAMIGGGLYLYSSHANAHEHDDHEVLAIGEETPQVID